MPDTAAPVAEEGTRRDFELRLCRIFLLLGLFALSMIFFAALVKPLHSLIDIDLLKYFSTTSIALGTGGTIIKPLDLNKLITDIFRGSRT